MAPGKDGSSAFAEDDGMGGIVRNGSISRAVGFSPRQKRCEHLSATEI